MSLPPWSDGCTVPRALRLFVPRETDAQQAVCVAHDAAYLMGGTRRDRAIADAQLLLGLLEAGMDVDRAQRYYAVIRLMGKFHWRGGHYRDEIPTPENMP